MFIVRGERLFFSGDRSAGLAGGATSATSQWESDATMELKRFLYAPRPMNARNDFDQLILTPLCAATLKNCALIALLYLPIFNLCTTRTFHFTFFLSSGVPTS